MKCQSVVMVADCGCWYLCAGLDEGIDDLWVGS